MPRILFSGVLAILTAVCFYTAYITGKNQDMQSAWFFCAFSLLFAIPLVAAMVKALAQKNAAFRKLDEKLCGPKQEGVRFVPHWCMMVILFTFGILVVVNVIKVVIAVIKHYAYPFDSRAIQESYGKFTRYGSKRDKLIKHF